MTEDWRCTAVTTRGASHARTGLMAQDAHGWARSGSVLLLCVADGAGSAAHADQGSRLAVDAWLGGALRYLHCGPAGFGGEHLATTAKRALLGARAALAVEAKRRRAPFQSFATTLLGVIATTTHTAAIQIGDGGIVGTGDAPGTLDLLIPPMRGLFANETIFLTSKEALAQARVHILNEPVRHLAVFSDGLDPVALEQPGDEPHAGFFEPLFDFMIRSPLEAVRARAMEELLDNPRLAARSDDDKTLVLATRQSCGSEGHSDAGTRSGSVVESGTNQGAESRSPETSDDCQS